MSRERRVLVVEDEPTIAASVAARLRAEGFAVDVAHDGPAAVAKALEVPPDVVVLDVMLPGFDGLEVCRRLHARRPVPVLMLTARDAETDVLVGLGVGADDYMTKPFSMRELVARVHALLRRVERAAQAEAQRIVLGELAIDTAERRVTRGDEPVHLTPIEYDLLLHLAGPPRTVPARHAPQARGGADPHRARRRVRVGGAEVSVAERAAAVVDLLPRPLDPVRSVKLKISILLLASGAAGLAYLYYEYRWQPPVGISLVTVAIVLLTAQVLAHGMTRPLRAMTAAARAMAQGDYSRRVRATSRDEVGQLAVAFNQMAADLATADQQRRELIANVSHELRTPIAALQAVLENLVDGLAEPDPATLRVALGQTERLSRLVIELLDLSRLDAGVEPLRRSPVKLEPFLTAAAEAAAVGVSRAHLEVDVLPADLEVNADEARLHQVVANLLDNAVRHSPPGGRVLVRARGLPEL